MAIHLDPPPDVGYPSLRIDQKGGPDSPIALFAVHLLQGPGPIRLGDPMIRIAQKRHLQVVLGGELLVACRTVPADSHHLCAELVKIRQMGSEVHRLSGAAAGVIFGIKVKDQPFVAIGIQADLLTSCTGQTEVRGNIANLYHI